MSVIRSIAVAFSVLSLAACAVAPEAEGDTEASSDALAKNITPVACVADTTAANGLDLHRGASLSSDVIGSSPHASTLNAYCKVGAGWVAVTYVNRVAGTDSTGKIWKASFVESAELRSYPKGSAYGSCISQLKDCPKDWLRDFTNQ